MGLDQRRRDRRAPDRGRPRAVDPGPDRRERQPADRAAHRHHAGRPRRGGAGPVRPGPADRRRGDGAGGSDPLPAKRPTPGVARAAVARAAEPGRRLRRGQGLAMKALTANRLDRRRGGVLERRRVGRALRGRRAVRRRRARPMAAEAHAKTQITLLVDPYLIDVDRRRTAASRRSATASGCGRSGPPTSPTTASRPRAARPSSACCTPTARPAPPAAST